MKEIIEALMVTAEVMGTNLSENAAKVFLSDLNGYTNGQVLMALQKCRREVRGRLTLADIILRIDDGHPGVEEAWAMMPRGESDTVVWTDEMRLAYFACAPLIDEDVVAARMAFKETYTRLVADARNAQSKPKWTPSLGTDSAKREIALSAAEKLGRISSEHKAELLPPQAQSGDAFVGSLKMNKLLDLLKA